ncbi:MAG: thioredoxin domain-containing protein [Anaerolineales bacterium]|nr:thioredoxin domain-containing protein [Anaerolineae bacterium]MCA9973643.1 thioredoxin domain-containing protein [Anaerolineales bacterium]
MSVAATSKAPGQKKRQQQTLLIGIIAIVAVVAVVAAILLSGQTTQTGIDFAAIPQSRTADGGFVLGNPDAPITIVEFADYACPACQQYEPNITRFIEEYVATGKAMFEYRVFATAGGQQTVFAGGIAECLTNYQADGFWVARERFSQLAQQGLYRDAPRTVANEMNASYSDLLTCQQNSNRVRVDMALGQQLGIQGTPAVGVRFGDSAPQFITYAGQTFDRGGVPFEVLAAVTDAANAAS